MQSKRKKGSPCKTGNVQREDCQTDRWSHFCVLDILLKKLSCLLVYKKCPCVHHPILPERSSPEGQFPPYLWGFGLAVLAFSAILASGIIIAVLTPKALMLSCHLDLGKKKIRVERRARCVQEVNGKRCEKMLERVGELSQISNISWKVWNVFGGFFGRWEEGFVLMNMHKYTAEKCYLFSSPTGQILAFEWLISLKSWITLQSINYGQADNIEKQQS